MVSPISVEVAYALPAQQWLLTVEVSAGASAMDALLASGLLSRAGLQLPVELGLFGRRCAADTPLNDGDRVEVYRPLSFDPMESRRRRAAKKA